MMFLGQAMSPLEQMGSHKLGLNPSNHLDSPRLKKVFLTCDFVTSGSRHLNSKSYPPEIQR